MIDITARRFRRTHAIVGFVFIAVFLATGVYMAVGMPEINQRDHGMRMMMRSGHVYILMAALVNVTLGCYLSLRADRSSRRIQMIGSALILAAPTIFLVGFFVEPGVEKLTRPVAVAGAAALGIGVVFQAFVMLQKPPATTGRSS